MPDLPDYPEPDEQKERAPTPERIIDRIINGRLAR